MVLICEFESCIFVYISNDIATLVAHVGACTRGGDLCRHVGALFCFTFNMISTFFLFSTSKMETYQCGNMSTCEIYDFRRLRQKSFTFAAVWRRCSSIARKNDSISPRFGSDFQRLREKKQIWFALVWRRCSTITRKNDSISARV